MAAKAKGDASKRLPRTCDVSSPVASPRIPWRPASISQTPRLLSVRARATNTEQSLSAEEELEELKQQHQLLLKAGVEYRHQVDLIFSRTKEEERQRDAELQSLRRSLWEMRMQQQQTGPPAAASGAATPPPHAAQQRIAELEEEVRALRASAATPSPSEQALPVAQEVEAGGGGGKSQLLSRILSVVEAKKGEASAVSDLEARLQQHVGREEVLHTRLLEAQRSLLEAQQEAKGRAEQAARAEALLLESRAACDEAAVHSEAERTAREALQQRATAAEARAAELQGLLEEAHQQQQQAAAAVPAVVEAVVQTSGEACPERGASPVPQAVSAAPPAEVAVLEAQLREAEKRCGELSGANEKLHGTLAGNAAAMQAMSQTVAGLQRKADALAEVRQQHGALLEENLAMRRHCEVAVGDTQRADELDSEVLQLSGHAEQLQAQLEVLRERAACAEQDAHEARAGGVLLRARAAAALEEAGRKRCLGTALCRLFLFVGVRQRQRLAGLHDDLRFRHAQVKAQHLAVEEARDCLGEQVKAVTAEMRVMHLEKEAVTTAMQSAAARHNRRQAAVQRSAVMMAAGNRAMHTRRVVFAVLRARAEAAAALRNALSTADTLHHALAASRSAAHVSDVESAARGCVHQEEVDSFQHLCRIHATAWGTLRDRALVASVASHRRRAAAAMGTAALLRLLGEAMRRLKVFALGAQHERLRERDRAAARQSLERASEELAQFDQRLTQRTSAQRAASVLAIALETTKSLQARALRRWCMWNTHRRALKYIDMERSNHRTAVERATDELLAAEKRFRDHYLQHQTAAMITMQRDLQHTTLGRYFSKLVIIVIHARSMREASRCRRLEETVSELQDESRILQDHLQEVAGVGLACIAQHAKYRLTHRYYALWKLSHAERCRPTPIPPDAVRNLQRTCVLHRQDLLRAAWLLRWLSRTHSASRTATLRATVDSLSKKLHEAAPLRAEVKAKQAQCHQLGEALSEATSERYALQSINDELRCDLHKWEAEYREAMQRFRGTQAQCIELGNSLAKLEAVLASKRALPPAEQWTDVMLFVQASRGWWKGVLKTVTVSGQPLTLGTTPLRSTRRDRHPETPLPFPSLGSPVSPTMKSDVSL